MKLNPLATPFAGLAFAAVLPLTAFAAADTSSPFDIKGRPPSSSAIIETSMIAKVGPNVVANAPQATTVSKDKLEAGELKAAWATWRDITYKIGISKANQQATLGVNGHSYDNPPMIPANGTIIGSYASAAAIGYTTVDLAKLNNPDYNAPGLAQRLA